MPTAKQIFLEASEIDNNDERQQFLADACRDDLKLRSRVEALLAASDDPQSFLDRPALRPQLAATRLDDDPQVLVEEAGHQIGPYKLLQEIGRGGFGVVYMAEQSEPVRRTVALKIIKPGMDTREVIARFEAERQALALMNHPNIARVLDAGETTSGRPYFVMELVKGVPLTQFCDDNTFTTRQRLELYTAVCHAVQHAHQKGVIHRDLKPSNIMVTLHDGQPVAKVIDFGISKAISQRLTEKTLFTRYGQMVGTPQYMSPEQAEMSGLDVDTRSDIYSLAVILYELLTGTTPLEAEQLRKAGYAEMLRLIKEEEAPRPSTRLSTLNDRLTTACQQRGTTVRQLSELVRRELDWIVMKGLEKDRNRRYATASELAEDVQRHLDGEPVMACPPTFRYRFSKYARRYRTELTFACSLGFVLATSSVLGWWLLIQTKAARDRVEVTNVQLRTETARAIENEKRAEQSRSAAVNAQAVLERKLYEESVTGAWRLIEEGKPAEARRLLQQTVPELRGWEWSRLNSQVPKVQRVPIPGARIASFELSPRADLCAVAQVDKTIQLFDLKTRRTVWTRKSEVPGPIIVGFSPQGNFVFAVSHLMRRRAPSALELWSIGGEKVWSESSDQDLYAVPSLSRDESKLLVCGGSNYPIKGAVRVLDTTTFQTIYRDQVNGFALASLNEEGTRLVYMLAKGWDPQPTKIYCKDLASGETVWSGAHTTTSLPIIDPASGDVIAGTQSHGFTVYDADTGDIKTQIVGGVPGVAGLAAFSPDGSLLSSTSLDGQVAIWDWKQKAILESFRRDAKFVPHFTSDNQRYAIVSQDASAIDISTIGNASPDLRLLRAGGRTLALATREDGTLLSLATDGLCRAWNLTTGMEQSIVGRFPSPSEAVLCPNRNLAVIGDKRGLSVVDLRSFDTIAEFSQRSKWWYCIAASADGSTVVGVSDTGLKAIDIEQLESFSIETPEDTVGITFTGPNEIAVASERGRVDLIDLDTKNPKLLRLGKPLDQSRPLCWMPTSNRLAVGVASSVEIWDLANSQHVATLDGRGALVTRILGSGDGSRLFVGDADGRITVWSLDSSRKLMTMNGHQRGTAADDAILGVQAMLMTNDGKTLLSGGKSGEICMWESAYPSAETEAIRRQVSEARSQVDLLLADTSDPQKLSGLLRSNRSLAASVRQNALKLVVNRGEHLPQCQTNLRQSSSLARLDLDHNWADQIQASDSSLHQLHDDVVRGLARTAGFDPTSKPERLIGISADTCIRWSEQANVFASLPLRPDQIRSIARSLVGRHPNAPLCLHLEATVLASQHQWADAHTRLSDANRLARGTELELLTTMQLAALELRAERIDAYEQACERLMTLVDRDSDPRWRWRVVRLCLAEHENKDRASQCDALLAGITIDRLPGSETAWLHSTNALVGLRLDDHKRTYTASGKSIASIVPGPTGNYTRSSALYLQWLAAIELGQGTEADTLRHRRNFVLALQPFLRSDTPAVHRDWEQWILHGMITDQPFE